MLDDARAAGLEVAEIIRNKDGSIRLLTATRTYQQERAANLIDSAMKDAFGVG